MPRRTERTPHVQSVERAAVLLQLVASGVTAGTCTDLAARAGLAVPTAHHLLGTLVKVGLLARDSRSGYLLGPAVAALGDAYERQEAVPDYLVGPLHELARTTGETSYLCAWRRGAIQMLSRVEGTSPVRVSVPAAGRYHDAHARAAGKIMLAFGADAARERYLRESPLHPLTPHTITSPDRLEEELAEVRRRGVAFDEEEFVPGVACIAVPVRHGDVLVGAYAVSAPVHRYHERCEDLTSVLQSAAQSAVTSIGQNDAQ
ncbi:MAG: IclR family transcriptional regulator [Actinobacteria bacterium]|nr:IclR family transcriptional regulator [Actinomycetota bacterium]